MRRRAHIWVACVATGSGLAESSGLAARLIPLAVCPALLKSLAAAANWSSRVVGG